MPYKLQLKPFVGKDGVKYKKIRITDITLHSKQMRPTKALGKKIKESFESNQPGRIFGASTIMTDPDSGKSTAILNMISQDPELLRYIQQEESKGCKILIEVPQELPILMGEDMKKFIKSKNAKRKLRKLAKNKNE